MDPYYRDMKINIQYPLKNLDFFSSLEINKAAPAHKKLKESDLSDEYLSWLENHNLIATWPELFYCPPNGNIFLHIDEIHPPNGVKMNWVFDQGETFMRWWDLLPGKEIIKRDNTIGGSYYTCNEGDYRFACQHRIKTPTLVNAYILHDVINPTDHPRWCVSVVMRFKDRPDSRLTWEEAIPLFSNYF